MGPGGVGLGMVIVVAVVVSVVYLSVESFVVSLGLMSILVSGCPATGLVCA